MVRKDFTVTDAEFRRMINHGAANVTIKREMRPADWRTCAALATEQADDKWTEGADRIGAADDLLVIKRADASDTGLTYKVLSLNRKCQGYLDGNGDLHYFECELEKQ